MHVSRSGRHVARESTAHDGVGRSSRVRHRLWLLDLVILSASAALAGAVGSWPLVGDPVPDWPTSVGFVAVLVLTWTGLLALNGEYRYCQWSFGVGEGSRIMTASLETLALLGVAIYLASIRLPPDWVLVHFLVGICALIAGRRGARAVIRRRRAAGIGRERVLLVGAREPVEQLTTLLRREPWMGLTPVGALFPGCDPRGGSLSRRAHDLDTIVRAVDDHEADVALFCDGAFHLSTDFNVLARRLERDDVHLVVAPSLCEISAHRVGMVPVAGLPLVFVEKPHAQQALSPSKRFWDVLFAAAALVLLAPLLGVLAFLIKREDGGPVFFTQQRIGRGGQPFEMLKLRTMVTDAEQQLRTRELGSDDGNGVLFKMHDDPRVTRIGRFMRRLSMDELPQLWNVLRGDMSIVGPRPALASEVATYLPEVRRRLAVRPGITGLWQVSGRSDLSWADTVRLDLSYVDNWSIVQDARILFRTARAVVDRAGAY